MRNETLEVSGPQQGREWITFQIAVSIHGESRSVLQRGFVLEERAGNVVKVTFGY